MKWLEHVRYVYPDEADRIIQMARPPRAKTSGEGKPRTRARWLTRHRERPLLEPAKYAVGPWNFAEVSPQQVLGRFNDFLKSVILRISEARDLGERDRFSFYDHMKSLIAAPPDTLRVDEKHIPEYAIPNCCAVIITTNHKTDGIYLPPTIVGTLWPGHHARKKTNVSRTATGMICGATTTAVA